MSERRIISYYRPRIQIPVSTMFDSPDGYALYCLPVDGAQALLRITQYLTREVTYIGELIDDRVFAGATQSELEAIRDIAGETEIGLMSGCDFSLIVDALDAIRDAIDAMGVCTCQTAYWQEFNAKRLPALDGYVDNGSVTYLSDEDTRGNPLPPPTNEAKCELAQAIWYYTFQLYSEKLLPFASETSDSLTAAIVAASAFGAVAGFVGIPVAVLSVIVVAVVAWAIDGAIANFLNWMLGTKDEVICTLYNTLPDVNAASAAMKVLIDSATEISYLDKQVLKSVLASAWHYTWIMQDQQENGTWDDYLIPGQCDGCDVIPGECVPIGSCNPGSWVGGLVECVDGLAAIKGGLSYWDEETLPVLGGQYLVVYFYPKSDGYPTARTNWGLTRETDEEHFDIITGIDHPVDVMTVEYGLIPGVLNGYDCYFDMQQSGFWGAPVHVCILDAPPP